MGADRAPQLKASVGQQNENLFCERSLGGVARTLKYCPKCKRRYQDAEIVYCFDDGEALVSPSNNPEAETLRIPGHASASQETGVRALIGIEVAENLSELRRFKDEVASAIKFKSSPMANVDRGNALKQTSPPKFKRHYWDALTTSIASSLSADEIKNAHVFYGNVDRSSGLLQTRPDPPSQWRKEVDGLIDQILGNGNPLAS